MKFFNMYLVNAFTDKAFNGNTTGVVICDDKLSTEEMQKIARDLNQTETVFVSRLDVGVYKTRFFTTKREIDLCGHATIATFYAIASNEYIKPIDDGIKKITQCTKDCKVKVELEYSLGKIKNVYMILSTKEENIKVPEVEILKSLGVTKDDIIVDGLRMEPKKIKTGYSDIVIAVKNENILKNLNPNFNRIKELSELENVTSFQVFTRTDGKVIQRTFSPAIDINEESASGTSTAATLYYINKFIDENVTNIKSIQGMNLDRVSNLQANMVEDNKIRVGGKAFIFMNGVLDI